MTYNLLFLSTGHSEPTSDLMLLASVLQIVLKWNVQRGVPILVGANALTESLDMFDWKLDELDKVLFPHL